MSRILIVDVTCCAGITPESHSNAIYAMKMCQIEIINNLFSYKTIITNDEALL